MQLLASFDKGRSVEKTLMQTLSLMNSMFSVEWRMAVGINLILTLIVLFLRELSHKLSLVNTDQLSCNSCSGFTRT